MPVTGGTTVIYNGVVMENVITREWDQEVVYDDSGTDMVLSRFRLRFEGLIHFATNESNLPDFPRTQAAPAYTLLAAGQGGLTTAAAVYTRVRHLLSEPRKSLRITCGDSVMLVVDPPKSPSSSGPAKHDSDVENGPKPRGLRLTHITGGEVFRVEFAIEAAKVECDTGYTGVLNNRWGVSEAMDENFFVTRTIRGRIKCSHVGVSAHQFKPMVVPGLEVGFKRVSVEFDVTPDGLTADYIVVDRQVQNSAPWPATRMSGAHVVGTNDGITISSEMAVRLDGPPAANKRILIQRAVQIVDARLEFFKNFQLQNVLIDQCAITDYIGEENAVEVRLRIRHTPANPQDMFTNLINNTLGAPLTLPPLVGFTTGPATQHYNRLRSIAPEYYGYVANGNVRDPSVLFLLHCYLQTPCNGEHAIAHFSPPVPQKPKPSPPLKQKSTSLTGSVVAQLPTAPDLWSPATKVAMYTSYLAESKYISSASRAQMPIAKSRSAYKAGEDTCVVVDLCLPTTTREIRLESERVGEWPAFPEPLDRYADGTLTGVLLDHWIEAQPAKVSADGRKIIYRAAAYYRYAMNRAPTMKDKLRMGVLPFTTLTDAETEFDPAKAYQGTPLGQLLPPPKPPPKSPPPPTTII